MVKGDIVVSKANQYAIYIVKEISNKDVIVTAIDQEGNAVQDWHETELDLFYTIEKVDEIIFLAQRQRYESYLMKTISDEIAILMIKMGYSKKEVLKNE